jgi:hypothetical protein
MAIPECPWRYGERYLVTDFVQTDNIAITEKADELYDADPDKFVEKVTLYVRDAFSYPLNNKGEPAASSQLKLYQESMCKWHATIYKPYIWTFPCEVMFDKHGICIHTANLAASMLLAKGHPNTWVVLGAVRSIEDNHVVGYHAWLETLYKNEQYIGETTIHDKRNCMITGKSGYDRKSEWCQSAGLFYEESGRYNKTEYVETPIRQPGKSILNLMGLPARRATAMFAMGYNIEHIKCEASKNPKKIAKEWAREEALTKQLLERAYGQQGGF